MMRIDLELINYNARETYPWTSCLSTELPACPPRTYAYVLWNTPSGWSGLSPAVPPTPSDPTYDTPLLEQAVALKATGLSWRKVAERIHATGGPCISHAVLNAAACRKRRREALRSGDTAPTEKARLWTNDRIRRIIELRAQGGTWQSICDVFQQDGMATTPQKVQNAYHKYVPLDLKVTGKKQKPPS